VGYYWLVRIRVGGAAKNRVIMRKVRKVGFREMRGKFEFVGGCGGDRG